MPQLSQLHIDVALTNLSIMYRNENYIGDMVLPVVPVAKRSDKYFVYTKADFLSPSSLGASPTLPNSLRRPGAEAAEIDFSVGTQSYYCEEYAYRGLVTDAARAIADSPLQPDIDQNIMLMERLLLDNEVQVNRLVGTRGNYPSTNKVTLTTGTTGTSWASYTSSSSNPFLDIKNGKIAVIRGIIREANSFVAGVNTARVLADHPALKDLIKYTHQDALTTSGLPKVMRGLAVYEGAGQKNTAAEGGTFASGDIWQADDATDMALIYYRTPAPGIRTVAFGFTFEAPDDTSGVRGWATRKWREEKRKGDMQEVSGLRDWRLVAIDGSSKALGGYLISSATI